MSGEDIDRFSVTFEQAEGLESLVQGPYQLKVISQHTRSLLWALVHSQISAHINYSGTVNQPWLTALQVYWVDRLHKPVDEFDPYKGDVVKLVKNIILNDTYDKVLGFIQYILRFNRDGFSELSKAIASAMDKSASGYALILKPQPTFIPRSTEEEVASLKRAFNDVQRVKLTGAQKHLQQAAEYLTVEKWAASVRESIHAVESVAKVISGKEGADLGAALKMIDRKSPLHTALKDALIKLYGYTSDEKGVRHALIDESQVRAEDAQFMLSACAAFVSYLLSKQRM